MLHTAILIFLQSYLFIVLFPTIVINNAVIAINISFEMR